MGHVAVPVRRALPHADGCEMRRLQRRHVPLVDRVVRYAVEPDLAVRPRLDAGPFDAVIEILRLSRREVIDHTGRATAATRIDAHADIVVRYPFLRIDHLPVLVLVGRARRDIGMLPGHALPRARIALLEGQPLGIGAVAQDHRICADFRGPEDIRAQHQPVIHGDRDIPVDVHAVAESAARLVRFAAAGTRPVIAQRHAILSHAARARPPASALLHCHHAICRAVWSVWACRDGLPPWSAGPHTPMPYPGRRTPSKGRRNRPECWRKTAGLEPQAWP